ncbi:MAG: hypothetical protein IPP68_09680 [Elusimicrobia bacterium]|nr:hypothetical protein [Elusimicrobiota bacterium]
MFLILVLTAAGVAVWRARDAWRPLWDRATGGTGAPPTAALADLSSQSVWLQSRVRDALSAAGVREADVLKSVNEERADATGRWVESTLEVRPREPFHSGRFLQRLAPVIHEGGLAIQKDQKDGDRWVLELGDRERVFQRLVVHPSPAPRGGPSIKGKFHV